jgi:hypothetical protein
MLLSFITPIAIAFMKERRSDKKALWENELKSLGIEPKRENELNEKRSLRRWQKSSNKSITKIIKQPTAIAAIIIIPKDKRRNITTAFLMVMVILQPYITFIPEKCL